MYTTPTARAISPKGASWNIEKPGSPFSSAMPLTRMFVEVPIRVHMPPKMEAKERGISIFAGLIPAAYEIWITTGMNTATTGVLLTKAEIRAMSSIIQTSPRR